MAKDESFSFAVAGNALYLEQLEKEYMERPEQLHETWRAFFAGCDFSREVRLGQSPVKEDSVLSKVEAMVRAYRQFGHLSAHLNTLVEPPVLGSLLELKAFDLEAIAPETQFRLLDFGEEPMTLPQIVARLKSTYCHSIGAEFYDVSEAKIISWLQERFERMCHQQKEASAEKKKRIIEMLARTEGFERFLHTKYLGQKRFSIEGLDSLIPTLDVIGSVAASMGALEVCYGMAHRGRLNVLAHIMNKPYSSILREFEGTYFNPFDIDGDVKYHMGYANEVSTASGQHLRLFLAPNPSHLEAVNPVLEGVVRRRQELIGSAEKVLPVLLHGDAAFMGQGIVAETLNFSQLINYSTGGTIHIITNNQIGFTTNPRDSRSCQYSSDVVKAIRAPVFHVNADDPEACILVAQLAVEYRQTFGRDIVIDLIGYRRHGHNETDEPSFTQPLMYKKIKGHKTVFHRYTEQLVQKNFCSAEDIAKEEAKVREELDAAHKEAKNKKAVTPAPQAMPQEFANMFHYYKAEYADVFARVKTEVPQDVLQKIAHHLTHAPENFNVYPKLDRILKTRYESVTEDRGVDWPMAELMAFGSLAYDGYNVRLSGQDCRRGTFSSRHAVFFDAETNDLYEPLNKVGKGQVNIVNSPLSELGCLGFEFGYSVCDANTLVAWEAQFGDFVNGAQIIIDQFLSASEAKWKMTCGLVLLLPHGYEGMGPEHSSARPERFLQSCGNLNMQVCNLTRPSQLFHLLRRQMLRNFRKPLIITTPKSLLRHPEVVSPMAEFTSGHFQEVLDDATVGTKDQTTKIILCTGKIFYELLERKRDNEEAKNVAILRVEQLYPFPEEKLKNILADYPQTKELLWVQEEPQNMGAWSYIRPRLLHILTPEQTLKYLGRRLSGSTAEGAGKAHQIEQRRIIDEAFALACGWAPKHQTQQD